MSAYGVAFWVKWPADHMQISAIILPNFRRACLPLKEDGLLSSGCVFGPAR
jgi:hypothetical protein